MGRPRTLHNHLPPYLAVKKLSSGRFSYYYKRDGKHFSLGCDEKRAIKGAERLSEAWGTGEEQHGDRNYRLLSEREILAEALVLGKICGVYFLIKGGIVEYVGKSIDVEDRLREHEATGRRFDAYFWIACHQDDLRRLETAYIRLLNPPGNTFKPPNGVRIRSSAGKRFLDLSA